MVRQIDHTLGLEVMRFELVFLESREQRGRAQLAKPLVGIAEEDRPEHGSESRQVVGPCWPRADRRLPTGGLLRQERSRAMVYLWFPDEYSGTMGRECGDSAPWRLVR